MNGKKHWKPSKFVLTPRGLKASRNAQHVMRSSRFYVDVIAREYEQMLVGHAKGRLLDLGCGLAPLYQVYRNLVTETVWADWEKTIHVNPDLDQTVDLNEPLPFSDSSFDTVLLTDVLEHVAEPLVAIKEISRVLRPSGKILLGTPFFYWVHEQPHDYYRYTEYALRRLCVLSSLTVLIVNPIGGLPEVMIDLTARGIDLCPKPILRLLHPLHRVLVALSVTLPSQKLSEWSKTKIPLGYTLVAEKLGPGA